MLLAECRRRASEHLLDLLQTLLRMLPWPTETGVRPVGAPDEWSPVLLTGNYALTVRRVLRALDGVDAWLVVAPSAGINVWCAASGGHLGTHQVVTALKTSGVAERVRHRDVILPQLAATGVIARDVKRRCGWRARFGPVAADDIPRYLARGGKKSDDMRHVRFGARERFEMALAWGGPMAAVAGLALAWAQPSWALPVAGYALLSACAAFFGLEHLPAPRRTCFTLLVVGFGVGAAALVDGGISALAGAGVAGGVIGALLTFDYAGSTPIEGGSHFEERSFDITLDLERCKGVHACWEVCPEACFEKPAPGSEDRRISLAHEDRCVRCGACIVQCPLDALAFEDAAGGRIEPDTIRRFKLNLLGRRVA
jgi:NAD-dependent dihydropyrimidine dehydrogenase PreA subunit